MLKSRYIKFAIFSGFAITAALFTMTQLSTPVVVTEKPVLNQRAVINSAEPELRPHQAEFNVEPLETENPTPVVAPQPVPVKLPVQNKVAAIDPDAPPAITTKQTCEGSLEQTFICLLNDYRESRGLNRLEYSQPLAQVALSHSQWMSQTGVFSHTGINGSKLSDRCRAANITCQAENLAENILTAQSLLDSWKTTAGHHRNLIGPYNTAGLGVHGKYVTLLLN